MKKTKNKSILKKLIIAIAAIITIFSTIIPNYSQADIGGVLLTPILDLVASVGDVAIGLLQSCLGLTQNEKFSIEDLSIMSTTPPANQQTGSDTTIAEIEVNDTIDSQWGIGQGAIYPNIQISPYEIFSNQISALDINFMNPKQSGSNSNDVSIAGMLQETVSKWYASLRNLSIVGLMIVLMYVGIRIIISSTAADKSKYKQMFTDWLVALCLVFFLHYIMSFMLTLTSTVVESISTSLGGGIVQISGNAEFQTNLIGVMRYRAGSTTLGTRLTFLILYLFLVGYTWVFAWQYFKRVMMMAFLTIIAPTVALTYPIDKLADGHAQAFNAWFREYLFNCLLQPFHLIIYSVLVSTAMQLAVNNPLYAIIAIGFMIPGEQILKKMFGFDKAGAGTIGTLAGFAGGTIASSLINKARSAIEKPGGKSGGNGGSDEGSNKIPTFSKPSDTSQIEVPASFSSSETNRNNSNHTQESSNNNNQNTQESNDPLRDQQEQYENDDMFDSEEDPGLEDQNYQYMHPEEYDNNGEWLGHQPTNQIPDNQPEETNTQQAEPIPANNGDKNPKRGFGESIKGAGGAFGYRYLSPRGGLKKAIGRAGVKVAKTAVKGATGAAVGIVGAGLGTIIGASQGKGIEGMITGATGGFTSGVVIANKAGKSLQGKGREFADTVNSGWTGKKVDTTQRKLNDYANDKKVWEYYREKTKKDGVYASRDVVENEIKKDEEYVKVGYKNPEEIDQLRRAEGSNVNSKMSAMAAKICEEQGYSKKDLSGRNYAATKESLAQRIGRDNSALSAKDRNYQADYMLQIMKAQRGMSNNLNTL